MDTVLPNTSNSQNYASRIASYFSALKNIQSKEFKTTYKWLCVEILFLISLGGAVRAMNAGLACPDWPLCFGDIIPDYHPQVYLEFLHRVLAGFIALVSTFLNYQVMRSSVSRATKFIAGAIAVLLLAQIIMGGLTVLLQLHEYVVAAHLGLGTLFFVLSYWVYLTVRGPTTTATSKRVVNPSGLTVATKTLVLFSSAQVLFVFIQIMLGGLVASHYAAQVCTEFPLCHGQWVPTLSGVIGLHVIHRLGAYALTAITLFFIGYLLLRVRSQALNRGAYALGALLFLQIILGITNVLLMTPPFITVLHLLFGTMTFGAAVYILRIATLPNSHPSA